jgi:chemotaxis protein MotB
MSNEAQPIVVRRIKKYARGSHGGQWKIAYADFVTAMMAFFLLMWLLGSTTKGELQGIAEYFQTPLKVALMGGSGTGDSSSVVKGGGRDMSRTVGQQQMSDMPAKRRTINLKAAEAEIERREMERLKQLKGKIEREIDASASLRQYKDQLRLELTADGLRVQIVDAKNRPMFDNGSARLKDYARDILREIAQALNDVPNKITLSGHTDATAYASGERGYSNWELSADRANASRRELVAAGISEQKMLRVVGMGSSVMLDQSDAFNPVNRRISITVMNKRAEERILGENTPEAATAALPAQAIGGAAEPARQ